MLAYNARVAVKSIKRNPLLSAIVVAGIALGICATTTFTTVRHMFARDPLPGRSGKLFYVRMDNWDPASPYPDAGDGTNPHHLPTQLTFRDTVELMRSNIPVRQTATFQSQLVLEPDRRAGRPYQERVRLVTSDFFPMFGTPFHYGSGWDKRADAKAEQVMVLSAALNDKLFGGANSVGKRVRLGGRDFTVVGVLEPWRPFIKMFDMTQSLVAEPEPLFIPFSLTRPMQIRTFGNSDGWKPIAGPSFDDFLASDTDFIQFWVELRSPADRAAYQQFVDNYVRLEKTKGRFPRPLNNQVTSMFDLARELGIIRPALNAMVAMSILFLIICALNLTGLLLGKFLARAPEMSVRRALGASRADIFLQHIAECEIVGVIGGVIGMLLSLGTLRFIAKFITATTVISLDAEMIAAAIFLSLVAGLIAGLYPAWRICTLQPAVQLKV
jgi:putative ABC transport system permease protein